VTIRRIASRRCRGTSCCGTAAGLDRLVTIPGSFVLRCTRSGHAHRQKLNLPSNRLVVVRGPTKRTCTPVSGSASQIASDVSCAFAPRAAPQCRMMHNRGWLGCTIDGRFWECGRFAGPGFPLHETCYLHTRSRTGSASSGSHRGSASGARSGTRAGISGGSRWTPGTRPKFVLPNFRGSGHVPADGSAVKVVVQRRGTTCRSRDRQLADSHACEH
jgi:hypothetical protein